MLSRRKFARGMIGALAGFAILPAATTYNRLWKATVQQPGWGVERIRYQINPEYVNAPYEMDILFGDPIHIGQPPIEPPKRFSVRIGGRAKRFVQENGVFREVFA